MRRLAAALAITGALFAVALTGPEIRIEEDDPRWNCATMGNRICGVASS